jgi:hypothetical protein
MTTITCNCCGTEIRKCGNRYEDYLHIQKSWGYLSDRDGITEEMNICADCLRRWESGFAVPSKKQATIELL